MSAVRCSRGHDLAEHGYRWRERVFCRACRRLRYHSNPEPAKAKMADWYRANAETHKEKQRARRIAHPPDRTSENERNRDYYRRRRAADPTHYAEKRAARRALEGGKVDYGHIWHRDFGLCHICGDGVDRADAEFDHVIPLSRGGAHSEHNIRIAHAFCNRSKGARTLEEVAG